MNLPNVDAQDFVRSSGGGGGGSVDVAAITQAATQAVVAAVPQLVTQQTTGLKQEIKQELKPNDLYAEYQSGTWAPQTSDIVSGRDNSAVYRCNFPVAFSTLPIVEVDEVSNSNRFYQLHNITTTGFDWGTNYAGTSVILHWQAYVRKP